MDDKILLFVPTYNCEKQITRVLQQCDEEIMKIISCIIVVNNRSTDNTENVVLDYIKNHPEKPIKLLRNNQNYGLGGSHKVAFQYAVENNFRYVIVLHGDDQGSLIDLIPYIKDGTYQKVDCLLGGRFMKSSKLPGYSSFRTFGNRVFNILFSIATKRKIYDLGAGLNMYCTESLKNKYYFKFADDLTFNCFMIIALPRLRLNARFFPITWREEDQVSNVKLFSQALKTVKIVFNSLFSGKNYIRKEFRTKCFENYNADEITDKIRN
ncbi:dolichyl-phosphate mannose synthase [Paenibacillus sp. Soil766]|uniref:glycosyltransferase family 2 protein n=1 Tax=Paenibacillus sp. Soil766 TaxID=1736404 RepID=UPI00070E62AE|nr:glycosyltransferase family 2 protein [Paenibacillus sp. Soil766]KRE86361.1 dolichyl-phosphate mannose synthase [Paenibacillus sp. Soil766]